MLSACMCVCARAHGEDSVVRVQVFVTMKTIFKMYDARMYVSVVCMRSMYVCVCVYVCACVRCV